MAVGGHVEPLGTLAGETWPSGDNTGAHGIRLTDRAGKLGREGAGTRRTDHGAIKQRLCGAYTPGLPVSSLGSLFRKGRSEAGRQLLAIRPLPTLSPVCGALPGRNSHGRADPHTDEHVVGAYVNPRFDSWKTPAICSGWQLGRAICQHTGADWWHWSGKLAEDGGGGRDAVRGSGRLAHSVNVPASELENSDYGKEINRRLIIQMGAP